MKQIKLPHFSRFFSALPFKTFACFVIWILLLLVLYLNISEFYVLKPLPKAIISVLENPQETSFHLSLAKLYYISGLEGRSADELSVITKPGQQPKNDGRNTGVLGAYGVNDNILGSWNREMSDWLKSYYYWKSVTRDKPDYVSAYIAAASYAYLIGKTSDAASIISEAYKLDPTNPAIIRFRKETGI